MGKVDSFEIQNRQVTLLKVADQLIKAGDLAQARAALGRFQEQFSLPSLKREIRLELANLYRRVDRPLRALRVLKNLFDQDSADEVQPTDDEICSYAACLISIGVQEEALTMLKLLVKEGHPVALLQRSFFHMQRWEYHFAYYFLRRYVRLKNISSYQVMVGKLNLASCLIVLEKFVKAETLLEQILKSLDREQHKHILKQVYRLQAQIEIEKKNYDRAKILLLQTLSQENGTDFLQGSHSVADLISHKWLVVIDLKTNANKALALKKMGEIQVRARELKNWETVRDCEFHLAAHSENLEQLLRIYWQTPYLSFRKKILNSLEGSTKTAFEMRLVADDGGHLSRGDVALRQRWKSDRTRAERLLDFLRSDSFRPFHIGEVFSVLYPNERFDSLSSPARVAKVVQRLNRQLQSSQNFSGNMPGRFIIKSADRQLRIAFVGSVEQKHSLEQRMELAVAPASTLLSGNIKNELNIERLRQEFRGRTFSQKKISLRLGLSKSQSQKLIRGLLAKKLIRKAGSKKDGVYMFNNFRGENEVPQELVA